MAEPTSSLQWAESILADISDILDNPTSTSVLGVHGVIVSAVTLKGWRDELAAFIAEQEPT